MATRTSQEGVDDSGLTPDEHPSEPELSAQELGETVLHLAALANARKAPISTRRDLGDMTVWITVRESTDGQDTSHISKLDA